MKTHYKYIVLILPFILSSCGINQVYTSASYGGLKGYTEKPIYNGEKVTATYASGSLRNGVFPQTTNGIIADDKVVSGNFLIHQSTSYKEFNYYYGLGGVLGNYKFNSDLENLDSNLDNHFNKGDNLNFYNINAKAGASFKHTWSKVECHFIGVEFLYINEFGPYMDKLNSIKYTPSDVIIGNLPSFFAFNLNTEFIFRVNNENNIGIGLYMGNVLLNVHQRGRIRNQDTSIGGLTFKYNYKKFTLSAVGESSTENIMSTHFGITYRIR